MIQILLSALPIAVIWGAITGHFTPDSLLLGYLLGVLSLAILYRLGIRFGMFHSLDQPFAILVYAGTILWSGLAATLNVVKLVLSPQIDLKTGIVALDTGDLSESQLLTALSAHGINMTPGELVIDIADGGVLYIHCLNLESTQRRIEPEQAQRIRLLRRITGEKADE